MRHALRGGKGLKGLEGVPLLPPTLPQKPYYLHEPTRASPRTSMLRCALQHLCKHALGLVLVPEPEIQPLYGTLRLSHISAFQDIASRLESIGIHREQPAVLGGRLTVQVVPI